MDAVYVAACDSIVGFINQIALRGTSRPTKTAQQPDNSPLLDPTPREIGK